MLGYIILLSVLLFADSLKNNEKKLRLLLFAIMLFSALRYGIGYDYYSYLDKCMPGSYGVEFEPIPAFFQKIAQETAFPYLFFILSSIFIYFFYWLGLRKSNQNHFVEVLFYVGFPFLFFSQLGTIRQGMASAVVFWAISLNRGEKFLFYKQFAMVALAFLCHSSAIVAILILIKWERIQPSLLWIMFLASFGIGLFITPLIAKVVGSGLFLDEMRAEKAMNYLNSANVIEGRMIKYLIYALTIITLLLYQKITRGEERYSYLISMAVLGGSMFALFSFNSTLANRLCMLFFSSMILLVPRLIRCVKVPIAVYTLLCLSLFLLQIYISSNNMRPQDRSGYSVSYPYETFLMHL